LSSLRLDPLQWETTHSILEFAAVSNRYYTVDFRNTLDSGTWTNLFEIPATITNRTIRLTNSVTTPMRFYRIQIPANE
jgi:hypothetical protein